MPLELSAHALGKASDFGIEGIDGIDISVLEFDALASDQSVQLLPDSDGAIREWALVMDVYMTAPASGYAGLIQTGTGDADLFLKTSGGSASIGTNGAYFGELPYNDWVRLAISVNIEGGETVLRTYANGSLVGEHLLGVTDRWSVDPDLGLRLFTDNNGETASGYLSSAFFTAGGLKAEDVADALAAAPMPTAGGIFPADPTGTSLEIGFESETINIRYGAGSAALEGSDYRTSVAIGDSAIGNAAEFGAPLPDGDVPVLKFAAFDDEEGIHLDLPIGSEDLTNFTMVWDINTAADGGYQALLQIGADNSSDADLFIKGSSGIGISSTYSGTVPSNEWARIAITVSDQGNGTSTLAKFIDGDLVGTQSVPTSRFTLDAATGFKILTDNDGETAPGYLAHFGLQTRALSASEIADLGTVDADGPFAQIAGTAQIGFSGYTPTVEFGFGGVEVIDASTAAPDAGTLTGIRDMLVTSNDAPFIVDLASVFGDGAHDFTVTNSNGDAVDASIEDGVLTLAFSALGLSDLVITATNAAGDAVEDNVRVRVAGEGAYTIAILPDTQDYTSNPGIEHTFGGMTQWLADNAASKGINFVANVGDVSQWSSTSQFDTASAAYDILRQAGVSFSVVQGNHDIVNSAGDIRNTSNFNDAFSISYMSQDPSFGGVYDQEPDRYDNNYHLWTAADGTEWIALNLEFGPRDDVLRWADEVLTEFGDRKAMVMTHSYNNFNGRHDPLGGPLEGEGAGYDYWLRDDPEGTWDGEEIWREVISSHANVLFAFGGHIFGDGAETVVSYNDYGLPVYQFLLNYQNGVALETNEGGNGGNGAVRLVTIDPENDAIYTETYFTELDEYLVGSRGSSEQSRDGLTGDYVGHQEEFHDANLGDRQALAEADAGADTVVRAAPGQDVATVHLSAEKTTNPQDDIVSYTWTNEDDEVIATGETADVDLGAGVHDLTLTVTTSAGVVHSDDVRVIVETDKVYLVETFNDGIADGWVEASTDAQVQKVAFGTDASYGLPAIGSGDTPVMKLGALNGDEGILVQPDMTGAVGSYTLAFDLYLPSGQGAWTGLLQTSVTNSDDGEFFLRDKGGSAGIGISGNYQGNIPYDTWNRIVLTVDIDADDKQVVNKYLNGSLIGTQTLQANASEGTRWTLDADTGFLLFTDENNETNDLFVSAFAFTPEALDAGTVAAMGGVTTSGPLSGTQAAGAIQLSFDGAVDTISLGSGAVSELDLSEDSSTGDFFVKGSARVEDGTVENPQGAFFDMSNNADNLVLKAGEDWDDLTLEVTMRSMDDDTMGVVFNYTDSTTHYLLTFDNQTNTRQLLRVEGGDTTVLAYEAGGYTFNDTQDLKVTNVGGRITATLDGVALFGGAVIDAAPLTGGTIGLYSSQQHSSIFDDVVVRAPELTADAGRDMLVIDWDGDGQEQVTLNGAASILPIGSAEATWTGTGTTATGLLAAATVTSGRNMFTLNLDGSAQDTLAVNLATGDRLIAADQFEDGTHDGWTIIDTTEIGGPANWQVIDGALTETSGAYSRELTWNGASAADVWDRGWSPLGDGTYALHKGSYALWEGNTNLTDYVVTADITAPTGAVGMMLNYVDENNYYKLEIDARVGLFTFVEVVDNYESMLSRGAMTYTPGDTFTLQSTLVDGKFSATIDGHDLMVYDIDAQKIDSGAAGVWSWGAAGASFDNISIVDLSTDFQTEIHGSAGNDQLVGTAGDDLIVLGGGRMDRAEGGSGADTFDFSAAIGNGARDMARITDFEAGLDQIDLGDAAINRVQETSHSVMLWVGDDNDQIIVTGIDNFDDLIFV
ncbi:LamG-like jellyroll fold domain-containing protein [Pseudoruegeria sp. SK021]|uniref:LamG-like jellyroll fold domain-containing protein n=1 Tax=Pseudoruegeria sp. SK021 TaxID=1933035 RepID=UPI00143D8E74|nr:LamG-like jellyroll fold domain-containing protein [Pseudoruegeria sp. SK021]